MLSNANDITPLEVKPRAGCYAYIFKRKNETIASVWTTDPEPYSVRVKLPVQMDCVDLMGNSRGIPAGDTELTLSESPQFLSGAVTPETMSQIIEKAVFPSVPAVRAEAALSDSSTLAVYLVNQTNSPAKTEIKLDPLKNVKLQTLSQKLTVPPSGRASASFTMTGASPETLKGETVTGNVSADGQAVKLSAELSVIPVPRAPKGMKVDGDLSKYAAMTPIILNGLKDIFPPMAQMPESGLWTGPDDLSVKSWLTWDEKFLYIAMRVVDDIHIQRQTGGNIWMDDCVQFAINAKNDALSPKITGSAGCGTSDYNMGMALTSSGPQCWRWVDKGVTKKAGLTDFPLSIRRDGNVTSYELAIPWDAVAPLSPKSGSVFKFSFVVFDQDKAGDSQAAYYMALTPGIAGGQDPSAYKTFMLTR
jgi:hypothetical protein